MKVFFSWSGEKSKETAIILKSWIRMVIQNADTWISTEIDKGEKWNHELTEQLKNTKVGIICINRENLDSNWILFEAGALSKTEDAKVCTFLLDLKPTDVKFPLAQFQSTVFSKDDIRKLIHSINDKLREEKERNLPINELDEIFEIFYPKLEIQLNEIKDKETDDSQNRRTDRELLEEILNLNRNSSRIESRNIDSEDIRLMTKEMVLRLENLFQESKYVNREIFESIKTSIKENDFMTHEMYDRVKQIERLTQEVNEKLLTNENAEKEKR